jgi:hypothetical protein
MHCQFMGPCRMVSMIERACVDVLARLDNSGASHRPLYGEGIDDVVRLVVETLLMMLR